MPYGNKKTTSYRLMAVLLTFVWSMGKLMLVCDSVSLPILFEVDGVALRNKDGVLIYYICCPHPFPTFVVKVRPW
jgi:hypothetical protein